MAAETGSGGWWWPFGLILFVFLLMMITRLVFWRRGWGPRHAHGGPPWHGPHAGSYVPAEEILRQRLAKGEIDEPEYKRLKRILEE